MQLTALCAQTVMIKLVLAGGTMFVDIYVQLHSPYSWLGVGEAGDWLGRGQPAVWGVCEGWAVRPAGLMNLSVRLCLIIMVSQIPSSPKT